MGRILEDRRKTEIVARHNDRPSTDRRQAVARQSDAAEPRSKGIVLAIFTAILAAVGAYTVSIAEDHRKREIEFVEQQIEKLYGPLFCAQYRYQTRKGRTPATTPAWTRAAFFPE
jgi:hypothetical protein